MSLINQVLQNVEARQGNTTDGWAGQVKPVLSAQPAPAGRWLNRLIGGGLLLATAGWVWMNTPMLMAYFYPQHVTAIPHAAPQAQGPKPRIQTVLAPAAAEAGTVATWAPPQLTRSLFSAWQSESASAKPSARAVVAQVKPVANAAAPQVEGEYSIKSADTAAITVATIAPTLETHADQNQGKSDEKSAEKGMVNKHVRPEQEVNVLIQRAVDHEQKGRLNEALAMLRQALTIYPQSEDARQLLAAYLFESRQEAEAVSVLQAGIKQFPAQVGLPKSLARWQLAHGQAEAVLQTLKPVASALAQDAESQWMLAMAYQQTGQHAAALPHFERATLLRPGHAQWMVAYAISLQAVGQNAQALQHLQQAQSLPLSERLLEFVTQRIRQLGGSVQANAE
ncbi:tetratricopeptide repeat protein [Methylophilus glucosoxydans]|uniref:Tetratricopeptide repeat protein n=1 Tax=Methylophilus glucosoxydans TaxID=752553 RepID=A0ABW3GJL7_9PROT